MAVTAPLLPLLQHAESRIRAALSQANLTYMAAKLGENWQACMKAPVEVTSPWNGYKPSTARSVDRALPCVLQG